jgi:hypothetical protein
MNQELKKAKQTVRAFLALHYTDERLAWLLAHARSGLLAFHSCCCLIGVPTADHALRAAASEIHPCNSGQRHLFGARKLELAREAEDAFELLGLVGLRSSRVGDAARRRRVIPVILAEMRRRARARAAARGEEVSCR